MNQYRQFLYPGDGYGFKPRFLLQDDRLALVPIPVDSAADFARVCAAPEEILLHETFLDRPRAQFPYSWALLMWLTRDFHARALLAGKPWYADFYQANHPSGALPLTVAILEGFVREARALEREPVVLLVPTLQDFAFAKKIGVWPDQPLADALAQKEMPVVHAGPLLSALLAGSDPRTLFLPGDGHMAPQGHRFLAQVLHERLQGGAYQGALSRFRTGRKP